MDEVKNVGRPLKFETPELLEDEITKYFESCFELKWFDELFRDKKGNRVKDNDGVYKKVPVQRKVMTTIPTITGLAVALKTSRQTLLNYEEKGEFFDTIKGAKDFIESVAEQGLLNGSMNATGVIFNMKNNFNWRDKIETDVNMSGELATGDLKSVSTEALLRERQKLEDEKKNGQTQEKK